MGAAGWARTDRTMRWLHLYTGLFLAPWMVVYAASAVFLNHRQWLVERLDITPPQWEVEREVEFDAGDGFPRDPAGQAKAILKHVNLDGAHRIAGKPDALQLVILRICGSGHYRVTWRRGSSLIVVERQRPFSLWRLVHFLHFRCGYGQPYFAHRVWAVLVDAVGVSMLLWAVSGVYLWARRPRKRLLGGVCVALGILVFAGLVALLCT